MASTLPFPILAPPRTPTPPPDDQPPGEQMAGLGWEGFANSPAQSVFDPQSLSPMDENFPGRRYGSIASTGGLSSNPLSPMDTNSLYSPISMDSAGSQGSALMENGKAVFNFQPTALAKSPVTKSVRLFLNVPRKKLKTDLMPLLERGPAERSQIQAQQRLSSDFPRAASPGPTCAPQFPSCPDPQRMPAKHVPRAKHPFLVEHLPHGRGGLYALEC